MPASPDGASAHSERVDETVNTTTELDSLERLDTINNPMTASANTNDRWWTTPASLAICAGLVCLLNTSCASDDDTSSPPQPVKAAQEPAGVSAIQPILLPDLSHMDEPVRAQLREHYESLELTRERAATPTAELGDAYGEMGKLLMAAEALDAAEPCYLNAQLLAPSDARWPYYLAHLYRIRGDLPKAEAMFEQVLRTRPDDVPALVWIGEVYLMQGRARAAEAVLTDALSLQPQSVAAMLGLGRAALERKDYSRAIEQLEMALAINPQTAVSAHYPLALAYRGLGNTGQTEAHMRLHGQVDVGPSDPLMQDLEELLRSPMAYERRGVRALASGDWGRAATSFREGLELAPDNPSLRHGLGTALAQMGDPRGAIEQFEETVRQSPEFAKAHYSLGLLARAAGQDREAIERFSVAVRYEPTYVEAHLRLAGVLRQTGRLEESLAQYQRIMDLARDGRIGADPRVAEAPFGYAITLARLGRYQEARDLLAEGLTVYPDQPAYTHALARLLVASPDPQIRDGGRALALMRGLSDEQRRIDSGETMAMILAEVGEYAEATAWQRGAIEAATRGGRDDALPPLMTERLRVYERQEPWRSDDPIEFDAEEAAGR